MLCAYFLILFGHDLVCAPRLSRRPVPATYFRKKTSGGRACLQIVESRREGAALRHQVITTFGRIKDRGEGRLERLLRSGARFADNAIVLDALGRRWNGGRQPAHRSGARLRADFLKVKLSDGAVFPRTIGLISTR
jgi:hypothetical protein